jgi:hypothetical protein
MAKVTTRVSVRGVDLKDMLKEAHAQLSDLTDSPFTVTDVDLYAIDDIASKDGLARLWSATFTMETDVTL